MEVVYEIEELSFLEHIEKRKPRNINAIKFEFYDDNQFKRRFRLQKETVVELIKIIREKLEFSSTLNNALSPTEQVLIALIRYYVCCSFQLVLGDLFQTSQPTICKSSLSSEQSPG